MLKSPGDAEESSSLLTTRGRWQRHLGRDLFPRIIATDCTSCSYERRSLELGCECMSVCESEKRGEVCNWVPGAKTPKICEV